MDQPFEVCALEGILLGIRTIARDRPGTWLILNSGSPHIVFDTLRGWLCTNLASESLEPSLTRTPFLCPR